MRFFDWVRKNTGHKGSTHPRLGESEREEARARFGLRQREFVQRLQECLRQTEKRAFSLAERIRDWQGERGEWLSLEAEQERLRRIIERVELAQRDTAELLHEWRDWLRALRQGREVDEQRLELLRSELRGRGALSETEVPSLVSRDSRGTDEREDAFSEWDQHVGALLPATANFWGKRLEEAQNEGCHPVVVHGLVARMRKAQGHAKIWRRMQG